MHVGRTWGCVRWPCLRTRHTLEPSAWRWSHWPGRLVNRAADCLFSEGSDPVRDGVNQHFSSDRPANAREERRRLLPSDAQQVYLNQNVLKSFCRSQLPHKSINFPFTITNIKNMMKDLCGDRLLKNDLKKTLCEIKVQVSTAAPGRAGSNQGLSRQGSCTRKQVERVKCWTIQGYLAHKKTPPPRTLQ